jgi:hypothetical protein
MSRANIDRFSAVIRKAVAANAEKETQTIMKTAMLKAIAMGGKSSFLAQLTEVKIAKGEMSTWFAMNLTMHQTAIAEEIAEELYLQKKMMSEIQIAKQNMDDKWQMVKQTAQISLWEWVFAELNEQAMYLEVKLAQSKVSVANKMLLMAQIKFMAAKLTKGVLTEEEENCVSIASIKVKTEIKAMNKVMGEYNRVAYGWTD